VSVTYNDLVSVDTLRVIRPSLVVWVLPPAAVVHALAVRLPYTPATVITHSCAPSNVRSQHYFNT